MTVYLWWLSQPQESDQQWEKATHAGLESDPPKTVQWWLICCCLESYDDFAQYPVTLNGKMGKLLPALSSQLRETRCSTRTDTSQKSAVHLDKASMYQRLPRNTASHCKIRSLPLHVKQKSPKPWFRRTEVTLYMLRSSSTVSKRAASQCSPDMEKSVQNWHRPYLRAQPSLLVTALHLTRALQTGLFSQILAHYTAV